MTLNLYVSFERGQHDDARVRELRAYLNERVDAAHVREPQVHEGNVGAVLAEQLDSLAARCRLCHNRHVRLAVDDGGDTLPHQRVVVNTEDAYARLFTHSDPSLSVSDSACPSAFRG